MSIITIKNVTKRFKVFTDRAVTLKEKVLFKKRRKYKEREVLRDISLTINKGEVVGLVGENGSGKSTLLKLMTGILYPEAGEIEVNGRVSSLLELGAGFHPDMSGRDNVYTNAAIYGLSKKETDERFQRILDFSELHEFIDNPVRTYSSGMYMRLAFSVAINVDADILLIDEILAVGDANFQAKCYRKLEQLKEAGITIVFVSHDTSVVNRFCGRAVWINKGRIAKDGDRIRVTNAYLKYMAEKQAHLFDNGKNFNRDDVYFAYLFFLGRAPESNKAVNYCCNTYKDMDELIEFLMRSDEFKQRLEKGEFADKKIDELKREFDTYRFENMGKMGAGEIMAGDGDLEELEGADGRQQRFGSGAATIVDVTLSSDTSENINILKSGEDVSVKIYYTLHRAAERYCFGFDISTLDNVHCLTADMRMDGYAMAQSSEHGCVECKAERLNLVEGEYKMDVYILDENGKPLDLIKNYRTFYVSSEQNATGVMVLPHGWKVLS